MHIFMICIKLPAFFVWKRAEDSEFSENSEITRRPLSSDNRLVLNRQRGEERERGGGGRERERGTRLFAKNTFRAGTGGLVGGGVSVGMGVWG